jgi:hypothetical protein
VQAVALHGTTKDSNTQINWKIHLQSTWTLKIKWHELGCSYTNNIICLRPWTVFVTVFVWLGLYYVCYCRYIRAMDMSEILWYKLLGNWETSLEYTLDASRLCACLRYRLLGLWWPSLEYTWQSNNLCHTMYIYIVIVMCATVDASGSYVWSVIWLLGLWGPSLEYISHNQAVQYWYLSWCIQAVPEILWYKLRGL